MVKEQADRIAQDIWSNEPEKRLQAIHNLLKIRDSVIISYLNDAFDDESDIEIKKALVEGLGTLRMPKFEGIGQILLKALHEEDVDIRRKAISSIMKCRDSSILNKLVIFKNSPEAIPIEDEVEEAIRLLTVPRGDPKKVKPPDKDRVYTEDDNEVDYEAHIGHYFD